ncbi:MAG: transporter, family, 3-phenylpropionic acid transporter [Variibacter sp.]|nr:transporter, family, 3-phenylpropionic acid transporter [Variibacter sp.]
MGFVPRLILAYGGVFATMGVQLPFLPLWLDAKGLDDRLIGAVLAVAGLARLIAIPVTATAADRLGDLRRTILVAGAGVAVSYTLLAQADGLVAIFVLLPLAAAFSSGLVPVVEAYALLGLGRLRQPYGPVRTWASGFFIVGNLGAGALAGILAPRNLIWVIVAICWVAFVTLLTLRALRDPPRHSASRGKFKTILLTPGVLTTLTAAALIQASHAVFYGFSTIQWSQAGLPGISIGLLWSLGVVAEIVLFALSPRLPAWLGGPALLAIGAAGATVRWTAMAFDPPTAALPILQCLHALSFGATHLASVQMLARVAPPDAGASAQGLLALASGLAMAVCMAAAGVLYAAVGALAYAPMAGLAVAGGAFAILVLRGSKQAA